MRTKASLAFMSPVLAEAAFADRAGPRYPTGIAIKKGPKRWRYYVSQATLQGQRSNAGSIVRVPAAHVEALVTAAVGKLSSQRAASQTDIRNMIDRVEIGRASIQVQLSEVAEAEAGGRTLTLPWAPPSPYRKREIIQGFPMQRPAPDRCAPTRARFSSRQLATRPFG